MTGSCSGCGLNLSPTAAARPAERNASGECWELYGHVLARSYGEADYRPVHQLVVDAYYAQHAGGTSRREVQSTALCLMTLSLFVEEDVHPAQGPRLHKLIASRRLSYEWLTPPAPRYAVTVVDVVAAEGPTEHQRLVRDWAGNVWRAWKPHHHTIRGWNDQAFRQS